MIDYIIPLPEGTKSGGKIADGLIVCNNNPERCNEVQVVRINKNGKIAAYCDGTVTIRKCNASQNAGKFTDYPNRDKETAINKALELGLADAPQEFIDLFENSWGANLNDQKKAQDYEGNSPENSKDNSGNPEPEPGTSPDNPTGETAGNGGNSGISGPDDGDIHNALYGG